MIVSILSLSIARRASAAASSFDSGSPSNTNVLGETISVCGSSPATGFYRDGMCLTGPEDAGVHVVCSRVTDAFLRFSKSRGNDLITAHPGYFPGLKEGDKWCLCVRRWKEALDAGVAPPVVLDATHSNALQVVSLKDLKSHALSAPATADDSVDL